MQKQINPNSCSQTDAADGISPSPTVENITPGDTHVIFEQGLNENMRLALRLEHLFQQFNSYMQTLHLAHHPRLAMRVLLRILDVGKRPDLKSKIIQSLSLQAYKLIAVRETIAASELQECNQLIEELNTAVNQLHNTVGRVGEKLYENEFLGNLHLQLNALGGGSDDRMPAFKLWLNKPETELKHDLLGWFEFFKPLPRIIYLLLAVARQHKQVAVISCNEGFYAQSLNAGVQHQILQFQVPKNICAYPEVSVGKHRLSIRFATLEVTGQGRGMQVAKPFDFKMALCSA